MNSRPKGKKLSEEWLITNDSFRHILSSKSGTIWELVTWDSRLTIRRQPGQGGDADHEVRDLRAELLKAEAAHFAKVKGTSTGTEESAESTTSAKRQLGNGAGEGGDEHEDPEAKRRRILEETRDIDADSDGARSDSSDEDRYGKGHCVPGSPYAELC